MIRRPTNLRRRLPSCRLLAALGLAALFPAAIGAAAPQTAPMIKVADAPKEVPEYEAKAGFLVNFAKYTTWPADAFRSADAPFVVGVLGDDPFGAKLDAKLKDKTIGTHPIVIERYESIQKVRSPHLLFVAGNDPEKAARAVATLATRPILLLGDCAGFAERGGTAGFYLEKSQIRFEMNPAAAKRARLVISAQVLKLARIVGS